MAYCGTLTLGELMGGPAEQHQREQGISRVGGMVTMILLTLEPGKREKKLSVWQLPASPAEIGEYLPSWTESASIPQPPPS